MMRKSMYLTGGQAKLDRNKNNKIDAEDFAILRKEKAKGRGMGLQDEKMKPGKVTKAALGAIALGAMTAAKLKKLKGKKNKMAGAARVIGSNLIPGMSVADIMKKKLRRSKGGGADTGKVGEEKSRRKVLAQRIVRQIKDKDRPSMRDKELAGDIEGSIAPYKVKKKMGGGMMMTKPMMTKPMMAKKGAMAKDSKMMGGGMMMTPRGAMGAMGGGMMMKPMGYKAGKSVKVKCKIGRNKPTKMY
jgi:hypothetical protein